MGRHGPNHGSDADGTIWNAFYRLAGSHSRISYQGSAGTWAGLHSASTRSAASIANCVGECLPNTRSDFCAVPNFEIGCDATTAQTPELMLQSLAVIFASCNFADRLLRSEKNDPR